MPPARRPARRVAILLRTTGDRPVLLARAVASVLAQDLDDWHLVLVRDGGDPAPVDLLLDRHDTDLADRVTPVHLPETVGAEAALAAALTAARAAVRFPFLALHDEGDSWDPAFLSRTVSTLSDPAHRAAPAALSAWFAVHEHFGGDELVEDNRDPVPPDDRAADLEAVLGAERFPPIALLCRADALDPATLAAMPPGQLSRSLARHLLLRGDFALLATPLAYRHHRADPAADPDPAAGSERRDIVARNATLRALAGRDPALLELFAASSRIDARAAARDADTAATLARLLLNVDRNGAWGHHRHEDLRDRLVRVEDALARTGEALARIERRLDAPDHAAAPVWNHAALRSRARRVLSRLRRRRAH